MNSFSGLLALRDSLAQNSEWGWTIVANHLWQSTLLAVIAFFVVLLLRQSPARLRYAIWLMVAAKFILPSLLLVLLVNALGIDISRLLPTPPSQPTVIVQVAEPVEYLVPQKTADHTQAPRPTTIYVVLTMIWFAGFLALLGFWLKKRLHFSAAMQAGEWISQGKEAESLKRVRSWLLIKRDVRLLISPKITEPGVWGSFRPVIVLPAAIADSLSEAELDAVMMHELLHVARWDNLVSTIQMVLCCLFWFHPLVWLIDRRLLVERESACDEQVIELGGAHGIYAASLLKVLKFCLGRRVAGVSAASGSDLKRRIEKIMAKEVKPTLALSHRLMIGGAAVAVIIFSIAVGLFGRDYVAAQNRQLPGGGVSGGVPSGVPSGVPDGVPGGVAGGIAGGVAGGVAGGTPGGVPGGVPGGIEGEMQNRNLQDLEKAPETFIQFRNKNNTPVSITEAKWKSVKVEKSKENEASLEPGDLYLFLMTLQLTNNTDRRIKGIAVELEDAEDNVVMFYEQRRPMFEPRATYTLSIRNRSAYFEHTSRMTARVVGVLFEDGEGWGKVPPPPPPPPPVPSVPPTPEGAAARPDVPPTAPPPPEVVGVRKSAGELQGSVIRRVEPDYPSLAKAAQVSGSVAVQIIIDESGDVISARALSGHPLLRDAAVAAARQWKFEPTLVHGKPEKVVGTMTFNFTL